MPAVSQQQQKLFGLALAVKRGEVARSEASDEVLNIVDSMTEKDIEDFASTSHEGLPKQVEARLRETLRELMREMAIEEAELPAAPIPSAIKAKLAQAIDKIKDTNLTYNQKLQVIGKVIDSLGVDKKELAKMSSKLKTTLESLNEDDPCWKDYEMIGMKKKDGKEVPNCVPKSESVNEAMASGEWVGIEKTPNGPKLVKTFKSGNEAKAWVMKSPGGHSIMTKKQWDVSEVKSVNEAEFGEKIQKLNNRITKLRGDLARTKSDNQKNVLQARLKNALQSLSDTKKSLGIKAPHTESVNEVASRTAIEIGGLTGMNKDAIQKFVDDNNLDIEKVFQFVKKGKLSDRMDMVSAIAGKPGNPIQKKMIKMFGESVKEGKKRFRQQDGIGKAKYTISYHDGIQKHKDGSDFFGIQIFKNQKDLETFKKALLSKGFVEESVNESNVPKMYVTYLAVEKKLRELEVAQKAMAQLYFNEKDAKKKAALLDKLKQGTKVLQATRKNLSDIEAKYVMGLDKDAEYQGESVVNEDANMNKKVKALLDKHLKDLRKGGANHQWAVMHILMGALGDANFHSEAKQVSKLFPKAKYEGDPMAEKDLEKMYHYDLGSDVAQICQWDGKDIVMAIGFYVSMTIGRPVGEKVEKLVESVNEAFSDNKNLNYIMKGRKITNVAYDSKLGFAVILDNGKYIQFDAHSARPGLALDMEFESVNEEKYPIAVAEFNKELIKHPMVKKAAQFYKKSPAEIVKVLQQRLYSKGDKTGNTKEVWIDFKDTTSGIEIKHKMKFNESNESHDCGCGCGGVTEGGCGGSKTNESFTPDPRKVYGGTGAKEGMVLVKQDGFKKILDLSKKNPSNVFLVSDDNYTKFGPFYVKNGKVAKYTVANPNYDFERNKVGSVKVPSDVILKFKVVE